MRFTSIAVSFFFAVTARAQTLLTYGDNALPTCAQSCTLLLQAQAACVPPAAPVTDQATYLSCFCQSGYLIPLKTSSVGTCDGICGADDLQKIQSWYLSTCQTGATAAATTSTTPATATSTRNTAASTVGGSTSSTSAASSGANSGSSEKKSWWSEHWKWVLMVIVLAIAFVLIAIIGVLIKRHYVRKRDKIKSTFNAGITHRSAPMTTTHGPVVPYNQDGAADHPSGHPPPQAGSAMYLPKIREKDGATSKYTSRSGVERGGTPIEELEMAERRPKGKGRMTVD